MSNYETTWGNGKLTKKSLMDLKKCLLKASKIDFEGVTNKEIKESGAKLPSNRTTEFLLIQRYAEDKIYVFGEILLDKENNTFSFSVEENNHSVEQAKTTNVFNTLLSFMKSIDGKYKKYGAVSHYKSEYYEDKSSVYYGGWK